MKVPGRHPTLGTTLRRLKNRAARSWLWAQAYLHISDAAVCEMSRGLLPEADYHDWWDGVANQPWHFFTHTCRRCGKRFTI